MKKPCVDCPGSLRIYNDAANWELVCGPRGRLLRELREAQRSTCKGERKDD